MTSQRDRQNQLETQAIADGVSRYRANEQKMTEGGQAGGTDWGTRAIQNAVHPMVEAIETMREKAAESAGRRHAVMALFDQLSPALVAFVTARSVIDDAFGTLGRTVSPVCMNIADRLQTEAQAKEFKDAEVNLFNTVADRLKKNPQGRDARVRTSTLRHAAKKFSVSITTWSRSTKVQIRKAEW